MRPFVFVRAGSLEHYDRRRDDEGPVGGGSYNVDHDGSEVENFHPVAGELQGYAQVPSGEGFNPERMGVAADSKGRMNGVLVVMLAGQVIAGWYERATLLTRHRERTGGREGLFNFVGRVADAVLIPTNARGFRVPRARGAMGRANVFYPLNEDRTPRAAPWIRQALKYVDMYRGPNMLAPGSPRTARSSTSEKASLLKGGQGPRVDPLERKALEAEAMRQAHAHFKKRGYAVRDTSRTESYDLLCTDARGGELKVEVKGTTTAGLTVELTANEVRSARTNDTALVVVSSLILAGRGAKVRAKGGTLRCLDRWSPREQDLTATMYRYNVPTEPSKT